jgi:hypothetical protein
MAATGEASADPSTSDSDGNIGTPDDRVDVFADGVDSVDINGVTYLNNNDDDKPDVDDYLNNQVSGKEYVIIGSGTHNCAHITPQNGALIELRGTVQPDGDHPVITFGDNHNNTVYLVDRWGQFNSTNRAGSYGGTNTVNVHTDVITMGGPVSVNGTGGGAGSGSRVINVEQRAGEADNLNHARMYWEPYGDNGASIGLMVDCPAQAQGTSGIDMNNMTVATRSARNCEDWGVYLNAGKNNRYWPIGADINNGGGIKTASGGGNFGSGTSEGDLSHHGVILPVSDGNNAESDDLDAAQVHPVGRGSNGGVDTPQFRWDSWTSGLVGGGITDTVLSVEMRNATDNTDLGKFEWVNGNDQTGYFGMGGDGAFHIGSGQRVGLDAYIDPRDVRGHGKGGYMFPSEDLSTRAGQVTDEMALNDGTTGNNNLYRWDGATWQEVGGTDSITP